MSVEKQSISSKDHDLILQMATETDRLHWAPALYDWTVFSSPLNPYFMTGGEVHLYRHHEASVVCFWHPGNVYQGQSFKTFSLAFGPESKVSDLHKLFDQVETDCQKQGISQLVGPILGKTCYNYRLTTEDVENVRLKFDPPQIPHLEKFLLDREFLAQYRYSTDIIDDIPDLQKKAHQRLPILLLGQDEVQIVPPTNEGIERIYEKMPDLINRIFRDNPFFVPLSAFDFQALYPMQMLRQSCVKTSFFIENLQGETIGFAFNFADPSQPGRLLVKSFGILPEISGRGRIFVKALFYLIENSRDYTEIAFCQMVGGNQVQRLTSKHAGRSIPYSLFVKSF